MATTVWKGHLTFGLVSIPVRLVRAARAQRVSLRQLYRPAPEKPAAVEPISATSFPQRAAERSADTQARLMPQPATETPADVAPVKRVYQAAGGDEPPRPIAPSELVKGYEYSKGEYVVLDDHELRGIAPKTSTELQIVEFVRFSEIDPVYLETSYYLSHDESGEKAYSLLFEGMLEAGYAAIGQLTMHRRDHVMILRPGKTGLIAHTMFYSDEVRTIDEFRTDTSLVAPKELDLAKALIEALATSFEPAKFKDEFRDRLNQLIESRASGRQLAPVQATAPAKVIDIMDALQRSLASVKATDLAVQTEAEKSLRKPARKESAAQKDNSREARNRKTNRY